MFLIALLFILLFSISCKSKQDPNSDGNIGFSREYFMVENIITKENLTILSIILIL